MHIMFIVVSYARSTLFTRHMLVNCIEHPLLSYAHPSAKMSSSLSVGSSIGKAEPKLVLVRFSIGADMRRFCT